MIVVVVVVVVVVVERIFLQNSCFNKGFSKLLIFQESLRNST